MRNPTQQTYFQTCTVLQLLFQPLSGFAGNQVPARSLYRKRARQFKKRVHQYKLISILNFFFQAVLPLFYIYQVLHRSLTLFKAMHVQLDIFIYYLITCIHQKIIFVVNWNWSKFFFFVVRTGVRVELCMLIIKFI